MEKEKLIDVLLIEDSLDDTELTIYSLLSANDRLNYRHFTCGEDAIDFVFTNKTAWGQSVKDNLKLIIVDISLPKIGGLDIARKFKESDQTRFIPIVVLSTSSNQRDIHIAYEIGVNSYVVKPEKFDGFVKKVSTLAFYWSKVNERPYQPSI